MFINKLKLKVFAIIKQIRLYLKYVYRNPIHEITKSVYGPILIATDVLTV